MLYLTGVLTVAASIYLGYVMIGPRNSNRCHRPGDICIGSLSAASVLGDRSADRRLDPAGLVDGPRPRPASRAQSARGSTPFRSRLLKLLGHREPAKMGWKQYAFAVLAFNAALFVISFAILLVQSHLPILNPDGKGPLTALGYKDTAGAEHPGADTAVIFNTVCSFVTNTNLQHYSGEQHLSYFSQLGAIVWLQFVTPGVRPGRDAGGDSRPARRARAGRFLPGYDARALLRAGAAVGDRGGPAGGHRRADDASRRRARRARSSGERQTIAVGPVAAEVAIKQLGTNGGGFFGPNSAHPFENPSPWSNLLEVISIIIIPMASIVMFGRMIKDRAHATVIFGVMLAMLLVGVAVAIVCRDASRARPWPACPSRRAATSRARKCGSGRWPRRPGRRSRRPLPTARSTRCTTASSRWAGWCRWRS